ncbi:MAG TPA: L,D-transpeptidase [Gemmatimonadaceae bacterium]
MSARLERIARAAAGGIALAAAVALVGASRAAPAAAQAVEGELVLRLNIPAFRLDASVGGSLVLTVPVAVGERRYATPVGDFTVERVVWNPWWIPPASAWARDDTVTPPGPENPMGKVKLLMRDAYYMHGTPYPVSIGRALSHGCIRMRNEDAIALARLVMLHGESGAAAATVDSLAGEMLETRDFALLRPVPVSIVYELAEVRGDSLVLHRDVYARRAGGRWAETLAALARAGYDTLALDSARIGKALRSARTRPVAVSVEELLREPL